MQKRNLVDYLAALIVTCAALAMYAVTLSKGAFPGESASLLCDKFGLIPSMSPSHPVYDLFTWPLRQGGLHGAIARLNWISAICGALCIWLLFRILKVAILSAIDEDDRDGVAAHVSSTAGGVAGAMALAFCTPFWIVATRASPATFDLLLLLVSVWLLMQYMLKGTLWMVLLLALLYGVGITEFATFLVFAPAVGLTLLYLMWQRNHLRPGVAAGMILCLLIGLSFYLIAAWRFTGTVGYDLRGYRSTLHVIQVLVRDQYFLITRSLPARGWLIILVVSFVPWLAGLFVARRGLNGERDWTYYTLHVIMTAVLISVLLNTRLAPWRVAGMDRPLITPYVLIAMLVGYLVAYWLRLPSVWWRDRQEGAREWLRRGLGPLLSLPLATCIVWAPVLNYNHCDGKAAGILNQFASDVAESLRGTEWLVSDGAIDEHILLAARANGMPLQIIDAQAARSSVYMKYIASRFPETRLRNLAEIGLLPMLEEWFRSDAGITGRVAVASLPELWDSAGYCSVPWKTCFRGAREASLPDTADVVRQHREFWDLEVPRVRAMIAASGPVGAMGRHLRRQLGFVANNLGVWLEDRGDRGNAFAAYQEARQIDPENISALLNMNVMAHNGTVSADTNELNRAIAALLSDKENQPRLWALARYYGYIRAPLAYAESGWSWAISGQRSAAVSGLKKAMTLAPAEKQNELKQLLAEVYSMQEQGEKSEALYREMLTENPKDTGALLGLARIEARKQNRGEAETLFRQAGEAGAPDAVVSLELALLDHAQGRSNDARRRIEALLEKQPEFLRGWVSLAAIAIETKDDELLQNCLGRIGVLNGGAGYAAALRADLALRQNDLVSARMALEQAVTAMKTAVHPLELLLRVDMMQRRQDLAVGHARRLLALDARNAFGNYVLGSLQLSAGDHDLAEDSLRASIRTKRSIAALNDLAWLLQEKRQYEESEKLTREVLSLDATMYQAWDTLGVIMLRTGRPEAAMPALEKALSISQSDPVVYLHMAELYSVRGDRDKARQLLQVLYGKVNQLMPSDQDRLNEISRAVDSPDAPTPR